MTCVECGMPLWDCPNATKYCEECGDRRRLHDQAVRRHRTRARAVPTVEAINDPARQRERDLARGY